MGSILTNRVAFWQVALVISCVCSFMAGVGAMRAPLSSQAFAWISSSVIVVCALPLGIAWIKILGWKRGGVSLLLLGLYAVLIEASALKTGFPYGSFTYLGALPGKIAGLVPWTVPFAWVPLLISAYAFARRYDLSIGGQWLASTTVLLAMDMLLDPGAVAVGIWRYDAGGLWHGVPWTNFAGWILTGGVAYAWLVRQRVKLPLWGTVGTVCMLFFWVGVAVSARLWLALFVAALLVLVCGRAVSRRT